jgi:hypothetical protein
VFWRQIVNKQAYIQCVPQKSTLYRNYPIVIRVLFCDTLYKDDVSEFHFENHGIHSQFSGKSHSYCYSLYREFSVNLSKTWKNIKWNYTSLSKFLSSKSTINDFNHRNFDRISELLKFRRYLYFRQNVRSSHCPFGKMSIRQNVRSAKRPFGKTSVGKMFYYYYYYLNIFIHGSLSVACFSKGRGLKLLKRYKTKSKPKV